MVGICRALVFRCEFHEHGGTTVPLPLVNPAGKFKNTWVSLWTVHSARVAGMMLLWELR